MVQDDFSIKQRVDRRDRIRPSGDGVVCDGRDVGSGRVEGVVEVGRREVVVGG